MYTARMHLGLNQRLGLSRNKVAVPEGVAGTPPFWIAGRPQERYLVPLRFTVCIYSKKEERKKGIKILTYCTKGL